MRRFRAAVVLALLLPMVGFADLASLGVVTRPVVEGRYSGSWEVTVVAEGDFEYSVFDLDDNLVAGPFVVKKFPVSNPSTWSDETPVCYKLVAEDSSNRIERVFGFAERVVSDGKFKVNGRPVRVKLGPKDLRGNAVEQDAMSVADAWLEGVYLLSTNDIASYCVERPHEDPDATRYVFQNWSVKGTNYNQRIVVENRNSFTRADGVDLEWTVLVDGVKKDSGKIDLMGLAPLSSATFDMPPEAIASRYGEGTVSVRFAFRKKGGLFSRGEVLAEEQIDLLASRELNSLNPPKGWLRDWLVPDFMESRVELKTEGSLRVFTAGNAVITFDESLGMPVRFAKKGLVFDTDLTGIVETTFRSRYERDGREGEEWIDVCHPSSPVDMAGGAATFTAGATRWTVYPQGTLVCWMDGVAGVPEPNRGLTVWFSKMRGSIEWFGLGPRATSSGDTAGAFLGRWERDLEFDEDFSATQVRGVRVGDVTVRTLGAPFEFSYCVRPDYIPESPLPRRVLEIHGAHLAVSVDDPDLTALTP